MIISPPSLPRLFFRDAIWRLPAPENLAPCIYLTFDDGPVPGVTDWVLSVLQREKVKATFFCLGKNIEKEPQLFSELKSDGHNCANHSYSHFNGWDTTTSQYISDIEKGAAFFSGNLFRPPYGKITPRQYTQLKKKYRIVFWDVISNDFNNSISPEKCLSNVVNFARNGSLIVFHDSIKARKNLEYVLPRSIDFLREKGYQFKTLE